MVFIPKDTRVEEAFEKIEQGVKDVYSSDNFVNYLKMLSKFHNYSFNNVILILSQYPGASLVAGYSSWKNDFQRQVNKGEKGIRILAPYDIKVKRMEESIDDKGNIVQEEKEYKVKRFRIVSVFDISQTDGEPLPELIHELQGDSIEVQALIQSIKEICTIPIEMKLQNEDVDLMNGAKGYYSLNEDKIVVRSDMDNLQIAKTLVHEYSHSVLHNLKNGQRSDQAHREVEAESLAFIICDHFGIDTGNYSFGYIASYSNRDDKFLRETLVNIQKSAHEFIEKIEPVYHKNLEWLKTEQMMGKYISPVDQEKIGMPLVEELVKTLKESSIYELVKNSDPVDIDYAKDTIDIEVSELLTNYKDTHPLALYLYDANYSFKESLHQCVFNSIYYDNPDSNLRVFLENSMERKNYNTMERMAKPLLEGDAYYLKYASSGMMNLTIERVYENTISMAHYGELNGDAMADPDVEIIVDAENKLLIPSTYQNDYLGRFDKEDTAEFKNEMNIFLSGWMASIKANHYKVSEIYTNESSITDQKEISKYCKDNGMNQFAPKQKQKEER